MVYLIIVGLGIASLLHLFWVPKQSHCILLIFQQQPMGQWFAASIVILAPLLVAFVKHKPLFSVVIGMDGCALLPTRKMYLWNNLCKKKIVKLIVHSICDYLPDSFVCFFLVTWIKLNWHIRFDLLELT